MLSHSASLRNLAELEQVVAAFHGATIQLEQTHEMLHEEVCRLTEDLEAKKNELARKNRLADVGRMAAHVARRVNDQMPALRQSISRLQRRLFADSESLDVLASLASDVAEIDSTVNDLLQFASDRDPNLQQVNLRQVIDDVCQILATELSERTIETVTDMPRHLMIVADPEMLRSAILNLMLNALDAMPGGGRLVVTSYRGIDGVELEVADSGPGLSDEARRRAGEPFFTTKRDAKGLGLANVCRIVEVHGGDVVAMNCPEGGAAFTLRFPQRARHAAA